VPAYNMNVYMYSLYFSELAHRARFEAGSVYAEYVNSLTNTSVL